MTPRPQRGLTLVELMVAMTLGLVLLGGVIQVFLSSKQTSRVNEALSRVQESGRFAIDFLAHDLRQAGYKGSCVTPVNNLLDESGTGYSANLFDLNAAIMGWSAEAGPHAAAMAGYRSGTDVVVVKHAASASGATASGNTPANANTINLDGASGIAADTLIVVADAQGCDIFQKRNNASATTLTRGATGEPGNKNPASFPFSHAYGPDMEILLFRSALYFVGESAAALPSLRRVRFDAGNNPVTEELVDGILHMNASYGLDTNGNREADSYVAANSVGNWDEVVAVRVCVVAASPERNVAPEALTLPCNGASISVPDRRLAQVFTTTIALRNRLP